MKRGHFFCFCFEKTSFVCFAASVTDSQYLAIYDGTIAIFTVRTVEDDSSLRVGYCLHYFAVPVLRVTVCGHYVSTPAEVCL